MMGNGAVTGGECSLRGIAGGITAFGTLCSGLAEAAVPGRVQIAVAIKLAVATRPRMLIRSHRFLREIGTSSVS